MVNLGHCYRKQQRWDEAIQVYERALGLCPGQSGTYAALGFTRHLKVRIMAHLLQKKHSLKVLAILECRSFTKAAHVKDTVQTGRLGRTVFQHMNVGSSCEALKACSYHQMQLLASATISTIKMCSMQC